MAEESQPPPQPPTVDVPAESVVEPSVDTVQETPQEKERDVSVQTQSAELQKVASNILNRRINRIPADVKNMSIEQRKSFYESNPGPHVLASIDMVANLVVGSCQTKVEPDGFPVESAGNPIKVIVGGEVVTVTHIKSVDSSLFTCRVKTGDGQYTEERIPKQALVNAHLVADQDAIAGQFSGPEQAAEQAAVEMYIASLEGGEGYLAGQDSQTVDKVIKEAADATNDILTTDDARACLKSQVKAKIITPKQEAEMLKALEGRNIIDYDTLLNLVGGQEGLKSQVESAKKVVGELENRLAANPNDLGAQKALADAEEALSLTRKAVDLMVVDGPVQKHFERAERGLEDAAITKQFKEAFRNGDIESMVNAVIPEDPNDTDEEKADKKKRKELLMKIGKGAGIAMLIILFLGFSSLGKSQ